MLLAVVFSRPCPFSNRPCATTYQLAAVTFHRGFTARSGHYVACVRDLTKHKGPKFRALKRLKVTAAVSPSSELVSHVEAQRQSSSVLAESERTWAGDVPLRWGPRDMPRENRPHDLHVQVSALAVCPRCAI